MTVEERIARIERVIPHIAKALREILGCIERMEPSDERMATAAQRAVDKLEEIFPDLKETRM